MVWIFFIDLQRFIKDREYDAFVFRFPEILVLLLIVLLIFGAKKIPELMKSFGKGVKSFKEGINGIEEDINAASDSKKDSAREEEKKQ